MRATDKEYDMSVYVFISRKLAEQRAYCDNQKFRNDAMPIRVRVAEVKGGFVIDYHYDIGAYRGTLHNDGSIKPISLDPYLDYRRITDLE